MTVRQPRALLLALLLALAPLSQRLAAAPVPTPPSPADSLRAALRTAPTDTARAKTALRLSAALTATDTARAGHYARQALTLSTAAGFAYGQAHAWLQLGALALIRHDNAAAGRYGERAQTAAAPLARRPPWPARLRRLLGAIANNRGNVADRQGRYTAAAAFYLQAATHLAAVPPAAATLLTVYTNLGNTYLVLNQPERAAAYWRQAVALRARTGAVPELVPPYLQLAALHFQRARPDSAGQALAAARPLLGLGGLYASEFYGTLGQYYLQLRQPRPARQAFRRALAYAEKKGAAGAQARLLLGLGQLDAQLGDLGQARARLLRGAALTEQLGDPQQLAEALAALARLEEQAGQWRAALHYARRRQLLRDTLAGLAVREQVNQLEARYRSRQQAQQLAALRREQAAQQQALRQQRELGRLYLGVLLLLAGTGVMGLALWHHRRRLAAAQREQQQRLLTTRAIVQGQEEERRRLARDLHDGLGGMLATVKFYLGAVRSRGRLPPESAGLFEQSIEHLDSSIGELRRVARNLMPEALLAFGLAQALQDLCDATSAAGGPRVQLQAYGLTSRLDPTTEVEVYRLVQELLTNARRHAQGARQVLVQLMRHGEDLQLVVEDDGCGFDPAVVSTGVGLRSVQARARYLGGTLDVHSRPGQGTSVSLSLKLPPTPLFATEAAAAHPLASALPSEISGL